MPLFEGQHQDLYFVCARSMPRVDIPAASPVATKRQHKLRLAGFVYRRPPSGK